MHRMRSLQWLWKILPSKPLLLQHHTER
jgi:hypothetical protein